MNFKQLFCRHEWSIPPKRIPFESVWVMVRMCGKGCGKCRIDRAMSTSIKPQPVIGLLCVRDLFTSQASVREV